MCLGWGGEEQVERGGREREFRVGGVGGGGGYGGVRIAGCGWVCQCHVSSLAPLASRLEDVGPRVWLSLSGFSLNQKWGECCTVLHPVITITLKPLFKKKIFLLTKVYRECAFAFRMSWGERG